MKSKKTGLAAFDHGVSFRPVVSPLLHVYYIPFLRGWLLMEWFAVETLYFHGAQ